MRFQVFVTLIVFIIFVYNLELIPEGEIQVYKKVIIMNKYKYINKTVYIKFRNFTVLLSVSVEF